MKTYKLLLIALLLSGIGFGVANAQKITKDSIHIRIDKSIDISISVYNNKNLKENITNDIQTLKSMIGEDNNISDYDSYYITYIPDESIMIKPSEPVELIMIDNGNQLKFDFKNQCEIKGNSYNLLIRFNNAEDIFTEVLKEKIEKSVTDTEENTSRFKTTYKFDYQGDEYNSGIIYNTKEAQMDAILLFGGAGTSIIRNQPITDISTELGFTFTKKGVWKNQYYISYNMFFNFDANQNAYTNSFLNIGYRYNLSNNSEKPNWMGFEAGYLISKDGDFFDDNTFKLGINWRVAKYVSVTPQVFFSGDLKNIYPGLRLGFGF